MQYEGWTPSFKSKPIRELIFSFSGTLKRSKNEECVPPQTSSFFSLSNNFLSPCAWQMRTGAIAWENSHYYVKHRSQSSNFVVSFLWSTREMQDWAIVIGGTQVDSFLQWQLEIGVSGSEWEKGRGTMHNVVLHSHTGVCICPMRWFKMIAFACI
jgi:hypothetical protein